jgi:phenylpropionate dioxygenase-like ring-hydroxylating dioxygenase large terminal subunit
MKKEFSNLLKKHWLIACGSSELKNKQIKPIHLIDIPIVLFRSGNQLAALLDFCPHRNAPLSKGSLVDDHIQCPYHGWKFSKDGICKDIPGLCNGNDIMTQMKTKSFNCKEELGYIWIQIENSETQIFKPKFINNSNYHSFN